MPDNTALVEDLIDSVPELSNARIIRCLHQGDVNETWLLESDRGKLVLKMRYKPDGSAGSIHSEGWKNLHLAATAGIGPEPIWTDPERGLTVCRFLEGTCWSWSDTQNPLLLKKLADTLASLHSIQPEGLQLDAPGAARAYAESIGSAQADALTDHAVKLATDLNSGSHRVSLLHGDLVHGNITGHGPVRLIDWEFAAAGDCLFDLATFIRHHELTDSITDLFLQHYSSLAEPVDQVRLNQFYVLYDLLTALWYLKLVTQSSSNSPAGAELNRVLIRLKQSGLDFGF